MSSKPSFRVFCPPAALSNFSLLVLVCPEQFITVAAAEKGKGLPVTRNLYDPTKRMDLDFPFPDQSDYFSIATQLTEAHNFGTTQTFSFPSQFSQPFVHFYTKLMNVQSFLFCCQICARLLDKFGPRDGCIVQICSSEKRLMSLKGLVEKEVGRRRKDLGPLEVQSRQWLVVSFAEIPHNL